MARSEVDHGKSQPVRLVDVFLLGPFMVWSGDTLAKAGHKRAGVVMALSGVATVVYNGRNYLRIRETSDG